MDGSAQLPSRRAASDDEDPFGHGAMEADEETHASTQRQQSALLTLTFLTHRVICLL